MEQRVPPREAVVDTNVLLRFLTDEPKDLAERAASILERAEARDVKLVVPSLVLAEVVYVLELVYEWARAEISEKLRELIGAGVLHFPEADVLTQALEDDEARRKLDFADAYAAALARVGGHGRVISFDRELDGLTGIDRIEHADDV